MKFKCFPSSSCGFARPKTSSHGRTAVLMVFEIGVCRPVFTFGATHASPVVLFTRIENIGWWPSLPKSD